MPLSSRVKKWPSNVEGVSTPRTKDWYVECDLEYFDRRIHNAEQEQSRSLPK